MQPLTVEEKKFFFENEKAGTIKKIKMLQEMMENTNYTDSMLHHIASEIALKEHKLHDDFGMSWEEIEKSIYA